MTIARAITHFPSPIPAATLALALAGAASAHHSVAMYDLSKQVEVAGTVKEMHFANPHIQIVLVVSDPKSAQPVEYAIEGNSPSSLARSGWTRSTVQTGDKIVVTISPLRSGDPGGLLVSFRRSAEPGGTQR